VRKKRRIPRGLTLAFAAVSTALVIDSNFRLTTTKYTLKSAKLPKSFDGYKIALLSDLHGAWSYWDFSPVLKAVRKQSPDLIALCGDFISRPSNLPGFEFLLRKLCKIAPVYFVNGNHESRSGCINDLGDILTSNGAVYLRDNWMNITHGGGSIILFGAEDPFARLEPVDLTSLVKDVRVKNPGGYIIMLNHRNNLPELTSDLPVDAILCGHSHGGVIRLPFIAVLIRRWKNNFSPYTGGHYTFPSHDFIVSRGLGSSFPLPRLFNNPELVIIQLSSNS